MAFLRTPETETPDPVDTDASRWEEALDRVRRVVAVCVEGDLVRLRIEEPAFALEVRRAPSRAAIASAAPAEGEAASADFVAVEPLSSNGAPHGPPPAVVKADLVGILRLSKPLVSEGSVVSEDRELAYVESLGTRNPVRAAGRGVVSAVFVSDGQPVDYGHALFSIVYDER